MKMASASMVAQNMSIIELHLATATLVDIPKHFILKNVQLAMGRKLLQNHVPKKRMNVHVINGVE